MILIDKRKDHNGDPFHYLQVYSSFTSLVSYLWHENQRNLSYSQLCYTVSMYPDQDIWRVWARILHGWGIKDLVASFLEAAGPLTIVGAQVVYFGQPLLNIAMPEYHVEALARLLEDKKQTRAFLTYLREVTP